MNASASGAASTPSAGQGAASAKQGRFSIVGLLLEHSTFVVFILMLIVAMMLSDRFYSVTNLTNILRQSVPLGVVSLGLLFVILTGGIDLSVGSLMALVSVTVALVMPGYGLWGAILAGLVAGTLCGVISGTLVAYFRIAPFIATLAIMTVARGVALVASKGQPAFIDNVAFNDFGVNSLAGLPLTLYVLIACFAIALFIYKKTVFGRLVISIGSNEIATRFAGIRVERYKFAVYAISGFACAVAGIVASTRTGVGSPILAIGFELDAIAAVVVGGASLSGGRGKVFNTIIGALILSVISNIMNLMNIPGYHQQIVKGVIIILAVMLESLKLRYASRS
ncbi:ABC transporter permease [Consotaella salsifontis]|uniref:Monosaccharide ABC transporter membrane protein, CUT2 family n=1 Tax=Consotaella salsifontis TaxID=1365950 RepID=A0A1T4QXB8_9HYPH|nr:ABC transporter permease [Consotaella salsifontis]SKA08400.1 monosaccharide ABC transporter membrane protein, CUT2 family [Consotaella salsifontis]